MKKYTTTEHVEVLSPEQHLAAEDALHRMGKTSAQELDPTERQKFTDALKIK